MFVTLNGITLTMNDEGILTLEKEDIRWQWAERPYIGLTDGTRVLFAVAGESALSPFRTGVGAGLRLDLANWEALPGLSLSLLTWIEAANSAVHLELIPTSEPDSEFERIVWPGAVDFPGRGDTVLSAMQGMLLPNGWPQPLEKEGFFYSRLAYMPVYGLFRPQGALAFILETPWDAIYRIHHPAGGDTTLFPAWVPSLGKVAYTRSQQITLLPAGSDYNDLARTYRAYLKRRGKLVTLKEKGANHPNLDRLIGSAIIHELSYIHIKPESKYYKADDPAYNDRYTPFAVHAARMRALKEKGVESAYLHLDGWGHAGYDNQHPDVCPPHEPSGGWEGLKALADTCEEMGYLFGLHDQYRDYYLDAPSYDPELAVVDTHGCRPGECTWYGGAQEVLCASQAPAFVNRTFDDLKAHGIHVTGSYLDVFSVVELDECAHPMHRMTRRDCAEYRRQCLAQVMARDILISSEETVDFCMTDLVYCHHAPYWQEGFRLGKGWPALGIPIPLFNLVYHDCVIIPWFQTKGGWGIPEEDDGWLHCLLNGGACYLPSEPTDEQLERNRIARQWQKKVAYRPMISHCFINGNSRRQRTVFEGGYTAEVDFDTGEYILSCPEFA